MKRLTAQIELRWLIEIVKGTKTHKDFKMVESRAYKPYWVRRVDKFYTLSTPLPFELLLVNGYNRPQPKALVLVNQVRRLGIFSTPTSQCYLLHISKVLMVNSALDGITVHKCRVGNL